MKIKTRYRQRLKHPATLRLTNPRDDLTVDSWPAANERTRAIFAVVRDQDRARAIRRTETPDGLSLPYGSPLADRVKIVDGSDSKTYIIGDCDNGMRWILSGTMRNLSCIVDVKDPLYDRIGEVFKCC